MAVDEITVRLKGKAVKKVNQFVVVDSQTGKKPDMEKIALVEKWAQDLCYCDMEGFALCEDGTLILMDECGRFAYCPSDRFKIVKVEKLA